MAIKKTEIIQIQSKPKPPYIEYQLTSFPSPEMALTVFEHKNNYRPAKMYYYEPPSGKFKSWIIKLEEE